MDKDCTFAKEGIVNTFHHMFPELKESEGEDEKMENKVMKANELMAEDWVYRPDCYDQVKEIRHAGVIGIDTMRGLITFNDLRPIPLTPEILEKNFESESNIFGLQTYKLNENFNLENRGDRFCLVRKCRDHYSSTFWICDLTYLHQLQHALRLFGIEKEIEL